MMQIRRANDRGHFNHGWLQTYHTFSFDQYYDPKHMHFRALRVINQDTVAPGQGFDMHFHRDMEIITYVIRGAIQHRDSLGNSSIIKSGEIQRMTAGTGVEHGEFNPSTTETLELLQIWILPNQKGLKPGYQQIAFDTRVPRMQLLVSPDGEQDSIMIHQDVKIYSVALVANEFFSYELPSQRYAWLQLISGELQMQDQTILPGDGVAFSEQPLIQLTAMQTAEFLLFDLN